MNTKNPLKTLKNEIIARGESKDTQFIFVKNQYGKDDIAFSQT